MRNARLKRYTWLNIIVTIRESQLDSGVYCSTDARGCGNAPQPGPHTNLLLRGPSGQVPRAPAGRRLGSQAAGQKGATQTPMVGSGDYGCGVSAMRRFELPLGGLKGLGFGIFGGKLLLGFGFRVEGFRLAVSFSFLLPKQSADATMGCIH